MLQKESRSVILVLLLSASSVASAEVDEALREQGRRALASYSAGLYEQSFSQWVDLYGRSSSGTEISKVARSYIYMSAYKIAEASGENCDEVNKWAAKGKSPGPPDYSSPGDVHYAMLLAIEGTCSFLQGRYEDANTQLLLAKAELIRSGSREVSEPLAVVSKFLLAVADKILGEGDYITNKGLVQLWIAKILSRQGDTLSAKVTYANSELGSGFVKDQVVQLAVGDCKELGAISADAALRGWKE